MMRFESQAHDSKLICDGWALCDLERFHAVQVLFDAEELGARNWRKRPPVDDLSDPEVVVVSEKLTALERIVDYPRPLFDACRRFLSAALCAGCDETEK